MRHLFISLLVCFTSVLPAHTLWLFSTSYLIDMQGEDHDGPHPFSILYGWGHAMPVDDQLSRAQVDRMVLATPDGGINVLEPGPEGGFLAAQVTPEATGRYIIGAALKPYTFTRFHDGDRVRFERIGKDAVPEGVEILTSRFTHHFAKTVVSVGDTTGMAVDRVLGFDLEILLETDPATLVAGSTMPFSVLFHGKPLVRREYPIVVTLTRLGFAGETDLSIDGDGRGVIVIPDTGVYQILVAVEETATAEQLTQADRVRYSSTTTFACTAGLQQH